jgi:D-sedoheptulose 7-phosphate isomerase
MTVDMKAKVDSATRQETVRRHLQTSADVKKLAADLCASDIVRAAELIADCIAGGGKILLCGNGGSAADCQHMAAEFVSRLTMDFARPGIPAIALTTDTSFLTAYANDIDFDGIFARQVSTLGNPGDVLIGISTSGRSKNVVRAVERAKAGGLAVVVLIGSGGPLSEMADVAIRVPSQVTQHIQESHLAIEHVICHLVERQLYSGSEPESE